MHACVWGSGAYTYVYTHTDVYICIYTNLTHGGSFLEGVEMDEERYLGLLAKLIGEAEHLQNNPAQVSVWSNACAGGCLCVCLVSCVCGAFGALKLTHPCIINHGSQGLVPEENKASDHVMAALAPYTKEHGGPLLVGG